MKFIKLPNGQNIRADVIISVNACVYDERVTITYDGVGKQYIQIKCNSFNDAIEMSNSIVAEIEAATGGENEP